MLNHICLLILTIHPVLLYLLDGTANVKHMPFGPMKCLMSCQGEIDVSHVIKEYHCQRVQRIENHSTEDVFNCLWKDMMTNEAMNGHDTSTGMATHMIHTKVRVVQCNSKVELQNACSRGRLDEVKHILSQRLEDINCRGRKSRTPVLTAARKGQEAVFDFLVSKDCDLSAVDNYDYDVLHLACKGGNTNIVRKLIDVEKCDHERRGPHDRTPVMTAAVNGHQMIFNLLVSKGCNLTVIDNEMNTILHLACISGNVDIVKYILSNDIISVDSRGHEGETPMMNAVHYCHPDVIDLLESKDCDLTLVDDEYDTTLHWASRGGCIEAVQYILSRHNASIETRGHHGRTPVMTAAAYCHKNVVELFVATNCNLSNVDDKGFTILHWACHSKGRSHRHVSGRNRDRDGCVDVVKYLISLGVDDGAKNKRGQTPVQVAEMRKNKAVVAFFKSRKQI